MAQSERGGIDFWRAKPTDPSARARARARARYLKKTRRPCFHEGKPRTKIRKFVAQMCPMDKSGWGYFSIFWRPGHTHGTPEGGLEEDWRRTGGGLGFYQFLSVSINFYQFLSIPISFYGRGLEENWGIYIPDYPQTSVGPKMHFWEGNLLAPDKSIGVIWTPPTAELSQKVFFETASESMPKVCSKSAGSLPEVCPKSAQSLPKVCPWYDSGMAVVWQWE